jgi:tetratricopeptide (TPR) repeat protein
MNNPASDTTRITSALPRLFSIGLVGLGLLCIAACEPTDPLEAVREGQNAGNFAATIEPLRELLSIQPKDPETNYLYGRALVATQSPELALYSLHEAMEDPEWLTRAGFQLAYAGLASDDFNEVVNAMTRVIEVEPENIDALLLRAQAHAHWKMDPTLALEDAEAVLDLDPDRLEAYEPLILAHIALEQPEEASEELAKVGRRLIDTDAPESVRAWHCSTTAVFIAEGGGDLQMAEKTWEECLARYPADGTVVDKAVRFFDNQQQHARSLEIVRTAYLEVPESRIFRVALAGRLLLKGHADEAEAVLLEGTKSEQPELAAEAWGDLGELRYSAGRLQSAADAFEQAFILTDPPDPQTAFRYADSLVVAGELDRALEQSEKLTVEAHQRLIRARVAQERGDNEKALEDFSEASRLWPDNPWGRYYAARSAEALGLWDRALEEYRYSIRINTGATDARTRAARLLTAQGRFLPAYHLLFLRIDEFPIDREGMILAAYVVAHASNASQLQDLLQKHLAKDPASYPAALIRAAEGLAENGQPAAARNLLRGAPGIDLAAGDNAKVLSALVRFAHQAGTADDASSVVAAALETAPNTAGYHAARGLDLELGQASLGDVRSAYEHAVELDPHDAEALEGLGRSSLPDDPERALEWFERARAADPLAEGPALGAARTLIIMNRLDDAARGLDGLIESNPFSAEAIAERADLDLKRGIATPRTLDLARRGVRLGRKAEDFERLSAVLSRLGESGRAETAAERARKLREDVAGHE